MVISCSPLSTQASDNSTPEPPAPVMMTTFSPLGVGSTGRARANCSSSLSDRARITPDWRSTSSYTLSSPASAPVWDAEARAPIAVRPGLQHDDRLRLRHPLRDLGERAPVLQVLDVHRDDARVVVLLEVRQQIVLVEVGLVAEADDGRHAHAGRAAEADDRHADAAAL